MQGEHTPGPWISTSDKRGILYVETDQMTGNEFSAIVCTISPYPLVELSEPERHKADARLIASAPELLDALEGLVMAVRHFDDPRESDEFVAAEAVMLKAGGKKREPEWDKPDAQEG